MFSGRQARYGALASVGRPDRLRHPGRRELHRHAPEQALGSDGEQAAQPVGPDAQRPAQARRPARDHGVRRGSAVSGIPGSAQGVRVRPRSRWRRRYIDPDKQLALAQQNDIQPNGTSSCSGTRAGPSGSAGWRPVRGNTEQDLTNAIIKVVSGEERKIYFTRGTARRTRPTSTERDGLRHPRRCAQTRELRRRTSWCSRRPAPFRTDASVVVVGGPQNDFLQPEVDALRQYLDKQGKLLLHDRSAWSSDGGAADRRSSRWPTTTASTSATTSSSTRAGWDGSSARTRRCPWPRATRRTPSWNASAC